MRACTLFFVPPPPPQMKILDLPLNKNKFCVAFISQEPAHQHLQGDGQRLDASRKKGTSCRSLTPPSQSAPSAASRLRLMRSKQLSKSKSCTVELYFPPQEKSVKLFILFLNFELSCRCLRCLFFFFLSVRIQRNYVWQYISVRIET